MKKFLSFLVVVSFVVFMPNVAKAGNLVGTWAFDSASNIYDSSGNLIDTMYSSAVEPYWEEDGEVRCANWWYELDPATSRYNGTSNTTLNNDMLAYTYNPDFGIWFESITTELYWLVIGDIMIGELKATLTGNYGLAGYRHDPSDPLQWDDVTGYLDFELWGYNPDADGMSFHAISSGSRVPIPSAILLLGSGLIGLMGFRRKFRKP